MSKKVIYTQFTFGAIGLTEKQINTICTEVDKLLTESMEIGLEPGCGSDNVQTETFEIPG